LVTGLVENIYVAPPFSVKGVMTGDTEDETAKSVGSPVVAPWKPFTLMVQRMAVPTR